MANAQTDKRLTRHWKTIRPSKSNPDHMSHAHLHNGDASEAASKKAGKPVDVYWQPVLKIVNVSIGLVKSQENPKGEEMVFLHFENHSRKLGLNATNSKTMESLSGTPTPIRWIGMSIQLYVDPSAKYPRGEKGPAIRIKPMLPRGADPTPMPEARAADVERLEAERDEKIDGDEAQDEGREPGEEG